jgi:LacI family transcriptional regulator
LISLSQETKTTDHLKEIINHNIQLVQFDRVDHAFGSHILVNDNQEASFKAVQHLISQGYKKIAFFGGPDYLPLYKERKQGYLDAIGASGLTIPYNFIIDNILKKEPAEAAAIELLKLKTAPDAFFTVSDYAALGVLKAARLYNKKVPEDIGIIGFSNEAFTEVTSPTLSSVSQQSKKMGRETANVYFNHVLNQQHTDGKVSPSLKLVIESSIIVRESSSRKNKRKGPKKDS